MTNARMTQRIRAVLLPLHLAPRLAAPSNPALATLAIRFAKQAFITLAIAITLTLHATPARADEASAAFLAAWRDTRDDPKPAAWEAIAAKHPKHELARAAKIRAAADALRKNDASKAIASVEPIAGAEKGYALAAKG